MTFTVQPERLDDWAARLRGLVDDADAATTYAARHLTPGQGGGGVWSAAAAALDDARAAATGSTTAIRDLLAGAAGELTRSAGHYRDVDLAEASRLEALLPAGSAPSAAPVGTSDVGPAARTDPAARLADPVGSDPVPDAFEAVLSLPDLVSPTAWLLWVFENVCGVNPLDHLTSHLAGDWAAFSRAAGALDNLSAFDREMAAAIDTETSTAVTGPAPTWTGPAAEAAGRYFTGFSAAVETQAGTARALARECRIFSTGMYQLAKGLADTAKYFLDMALLMALAAAAGTFSAFTGVGGVLGAAAAITAFAATNYAWIKVGEAVGNLYGFANAFVGLMARTMAPLRDVTEHPLPAGAYDHPQA